jgi:hypothetical protein
MHICSLGQSTNPSPFQGPTRIIRLNHWLACLETADIIISTPAEGCCLIDLSKRPCFLLFKPYLFSGSQVKKTSRSPYLNGTVVFKSLDVAMKFRRSNIGMCAFPFVRSLGVVYTDIIGHALPIKKCICLSLNLYCSNDRLSLCQGYQT